MSNNRMSASEYKKLLQKFMENFGKIYCDYPIKSQAIKKTSDDDVPQKSPS